MQANGGSYWSWYPTGSTVPTRAVTVAGRSGVWVLESGASLVGTATGAGIVNVVLAYGVDNTGATDAGPNLNTAAAALAVAGQAGVIPAGTYKLTTAVTVVPGMRWVVAPGVSFTGANAASMSAQASPSTLQQLGTVGSPVDTRIWAVQARDINKAPFSAYLHDQLFVATHDSVLFWGYNADNSVTSEPIVRWAIEQDYDDGSGHHKSEIYLETYTAGQLHQNRPFFTSLDRTDATSYSMLQYQGAAGFVSIGDIGGALAAKFEPAGIFNNVPLYGGSGLTAAVPFGAGVKGDSGTSQPFVFANGTSTINVSGGPGTITATAAQYQYPYLVIIGTPTSGAANKLALPTVVGAAWIVDCTGVTFTGGATLTPSVTAGDWGTAIGITNQTSLFMLTVGNDGKLHGVAMSP